MPVYSYRAVDLDASEVAGDVAADTPRQARDLLRARGLTVEQVLARPQRSRATWWQRRRARRQATEAAALIRDLSTLLAAGIPLLEALDTLSRQYRGAARAVLLSLRDRIAAGDGLADAMGQSRPFFDDLCVSITEVGENTGTLDAALSRLADFKEHAQRLRSRVGTALLYPGIVATVGVAVMLFLMTFVVPNLLSALQQSGKPLPAVTRAVKAASDFLLGWGWLLGLAVVLAAAGLRAAAGTRRGRRTCDRLVLRLPWIGDLIRKETMARLAVVLAALLRSGVVFLQALQVARRTVSNSVYREALAHCEEAVGAGQDIAAPLERTGVFPPMVVQMLSVGQQAGQLEVMLDRLAAAYEHHVETAAARLAAVLEPALVVVLAVMVGLIAFATILPILEASNVL